MITQTGLLRKFSAQCRARASDPQQMNLKGHELQDALETAVMTGRWDKIPRHLVQLPGTTHNNENAYAVFRYLGRVGDREYFLDVMESSVERRHSWNGLLYVARASRRRPCKVTQVLSAQVNERLVTLIMGAVARMLKRKLPFFRIPRGYYPYGYFANWSGTRWGRRKHHTLHKSGILVAPTMRQACRLLIKEFHGYDSVDSLRILTSNGYVLLDTVLGGEREYGLSPEFFKRGKLRVLRRHRRAA